MGRADDYNTEQSRTVLFLKTVTRASQNKCGQNLCAACKKKEEETRRYSAQELTVPEGTLYDNNSFNQ